MRTARSPPDWTAILFSLGLSTCGVTDDRTGRVRADAAALWKQMPWSHAAGYGFVAAFGVYVVTVLFLTIEVFAMAGSGLGGVGTKSFLLGTLGDSYGAHLGVAGSVSPGVAGVGVVPTPVYALVPPPLLVWAGRACATETASRSALSATRRGAAITLGYGGTVAAGLGVLAVTADFAPLSIDPVGTVLVVGFVYPLVFGGLGGYSRRGR